MTNQTPTNGDSQWLDKVLNNMVSDHIDIPGMDKDSCLAWIEDYKHAKAAIQAHIAEQVRLAEQHIVDVLKEHAVASDGETYFIKITKASLDKLSSPIQGEAEV